MYLVPSEDFSLSISRRAGGSAVCYFDITSSPVSANTDILDEGTTRLGVPSPHLSYNINLETSQQFGLASIQQFTGSSKLQKYKSVQQSAKLF